MKDREPHSGQCGAAGWSFAGTRTAAGKFGTGSADPRRAIHRPPDAPPQGICRAASSTFVRELRVEGSFEQRDAPGRIERFVPRLASRAGAADGGDPRLRF